ncbi:MAG: hypothetical protein B7Z53_03705 [Rhodospirillales bacterium 12-71-4]|nr:MAG: hypothetical protein B7Z53_03705 [Rhodospirillales bacterium 12-71-4]
MQRAGRGLGGEIRQVVGQAQKLLRHRLDLRFRFGQAVGWAGAGGLGHEREAGSAQFLRGQ